MTPVEHIRAACKKARENKGAELTLEEKDRIVNETVAALIAAAVPGKKRKPKGAPRDRNPLFDALALATGTRDLSQMTRMGAKECGVALADILAVTPDLTPEEITRRAQLYIRRWPDPRNLTPMAFAKRWGEFALSSAEAKTRAAKYDVYQEPANWHAAAVAVFGESVAVQMKEKGWFEFGTDLRAKILDHLRRQNGNAS